MSLSGSYVSPEVESPSLFFVAREVLDIVNAEFEQLGRIEILKALFPEAWSDLRFLKQSFHTFHLPFLECFGLCWLLFPIFFGKFSKVAVAELAGYSVNVEVYVTRESSGSFALTTRQDRRVLQC